MSLLKVATLVIGVIIIGFLGGYQEGKHQADNYWSHHAGCSSDGITWYPAREDSMCYSADDPVKAPVKVGKPDPNPQACDKPWTEEVKGTCSVIVLGPVIVQPHPKHKGTICHYSKDLDQTICIYSLEDQKD